MPNILIRVKKNKIKSRPPASFSQKKCLRNKLFFFWPKTKKNEAEKNLVFLAVSAFVGFTLAFDLCPLVMIFVLVIVFRRVGVPSLD